LLFLLENNANLEYENIHNANCLDTAVVNGNYEIALHLLNLNRLELKEISFYIELSKKTKIPVFNLILFIETLEARVNPSEVPNFALSSADKYSKFNSLH
jgi:hypothetical protein